MHSVNNLCSVVSVVLLCYCVSSGIHFGNYCTLHTCIRADYLLTTLPHWAHTYGWYDHHGSTAVPIAVGGHNNDSVCHIVGHSDWNTCSTGGDWTDTWSDHDGVANWISTIILWGLPLYCEGHIVLTILLNSGGKIIGRRGRTCW